MSKSFRKVCRHGSAALAVTLAACAGQQPVEPAPEPAPPEPKQPVVRQVPDRPFEPDTLYALLVAEIAGSRNRYDIAISNYVQQALATRDPNVTARAARIARLLGAHEAALQMARLWLNLEPDNPEAHFIAGAELASIGELKEATEHSARLLSYGEAGFFEAIAAKAVQLEDKERATQLQRQFARLLQAYPDSASLRLAQSLLLHYMGDLEAALTEARRAAELEPGNYQSHLQEMRLLQALGRTEQATQGLARLVKQFPQNQRLRLQYARVLARSDLETAQDQFKTLVEQSPGDPDFTFSLGLIQLERGLLVEAREQFESLLDGEAHRDAAHYYLGQIAEAQGQKQEALQHFQAVETGTEYLPAVMQATELLVQTDSLAGAIDYLQAERAQAAPEARDSLYLLEAELLKDAGLPASAMDTFNSGLESHPDSTRLRYARAMLYAQMDLVEKAEQDLKHIIEQAPDNAAALNALGYTLADKTDRLREAYDYIKTALKLEPEDAAILDSMGWVQYRMGNLGEAVKYLRKAMEKTPDPEIAAHLGEVLWVTGEREQALRTWEAGLKLNPDSEVIQNTVRRLNAEISGTP